MLKTLKSLSNIDKNPKNTTFTLSIFSTTISNQTNYSLEVPHK